jgi:uroporphyrinogen-III synthase
MPAGELQGVHAVVTRPAHQAQGLCERIEAEGGIAVRFPVLEIVPKIDTEFLQLIARLSDYHIALFISPNAVNCALPSIKETIKEATKESGGFPAQLRIGAVGKATADALRDWGCPVSILPQQRFDSEALLALPALNNVQGKNIVIFRGVGGREHLADSLRQRGARVHYAECYERRKPHSDPGILQRQWAQNALDIIIVTSVQGLKNLMELAGDAAREELLHTPLLVVSDRMTQQARQWGFKADIVCAAKASDPQVVEALCQWARQRHELH